MDKILHFASLKTARLLFALPLAAISLISFAGWYSAKLPGGKATTLLIAVAYFLAAIAIVTDYHHYGRNASLLVAGVLTLFIVVIHIPAIAAASSETSLVSPLLDLFKDVGLVGGAIALAATFRE